MRSLFERWQAAMAGGHEQYEEHKLYPYLEARYPVSLEPLQAGHRQLDDSWHGSEPVFDLAGQYVRAAHDDQLLLASGDAQIARLVVPAEVAGAEKSPSKAAALVSGSRQ